MNSSTPGPSTSHRLVGTAMLCACAGLAVPALGQERHWNTGTGSWHNPANWSPFGVPLPSHKVWIGSLVAAENARVDLDQSVAVLGLTVSNGMTLENDFRSLTVAGTTTITGSNTVLIGGVPTAYPSRLELTPTDGTEFTTHNLMLSSGGRVECIVGPVYPEVEGTLTIGTGSRITGMALFNIHGGGTSFVCNGMVSPGWGTGGNLSFVQGPAGGLFDLDGTTGNGHLNLDDETAILHFAGNGLSDPFSGTISLTSTTWLQANFVNGWAADSSSLIEMTGTGFGSGVAIISGSDLTLGGDVSVGGSYGYLRFASDVIMEPSASFSIAEWGKLEFFSNSEQFTATVNGGQYDLAEGAALWFNTPVELNGGSFVLADDALMTFEGPTKVTGGTVEIAPGRYVAFAGSTEWAGSFTVTAMGAGGGRVFVDGAASVTAPTVINATVFDMDGGFGTPENNWAISSSLIVNTESIDDSAGNFLDADLYIGGGLFGKLTINMANPAFPWFVEDHMDLTGDLTLYPTRVAGTKFGVNGTLNLIGGRAQITADAMFEPGCEINIGPASADLRMRGATTVYAGAEFTGAGTLRNGADGVMVLRDGASLDQTGLVNEATLQISGTGAVSVDRYQSTTNASIRFALGGYASGSDHDLLLVSGGAAALAGTIQVELVALGGVVFHPSIGDEFTILTALGGVTGTFSNNPVTVAAAGTYGWTVLYNPNTVVLRLSSFVPAPCYANCDGSTTAPILNVNDFICFQTKFAGGSPYANCDGSTTSPILNVNDFICFQSKYAAGCP